MPGFGITLTLGHFFFLAGLGMLYLFSFAHEIVFVLVGLVFAIVGACFLIPCMRHLVKKRQARSGHIVHASVIGYELNGRITVNGKHPYIFFCESGGQKYRFQTLRYYDPDDFLGKTVDVYVSDKDESVYEVDEKSLR